MLGWQDRVVAEPGTASPDLCRSDGVGCRAALAPATSGAEAGNLLPKNRARVACEGEGHATTRNSILPPPGLAVLAPGVGTRWRCARRSALATWTVLAVSGCGSSGQDRGASATTVAPSTPAEANGAAVQPSEPAQPTENALEAGPAGDIPLDDGRPSDVPPSVDANEVITNVRVAVHPRVNTLLLVTWDQTLATDSTWLEFSVEGESVMKSRPRTGEPGAHRDVVIGVPGSTNVTLRIVAERNGEQIVSRDYQGTTLAVPGGMPVPDVLAYEPALASPDRWLFGSVEDSDGGCNNQSCYYHTTFWLYIMDRQGRIVWYYADPASNATSSFQRIARDGEYIWIEKRAFSGNAQLGVLKMTLDWSYMEEIPVPRLADAIDVTTDGSLLYNVDRQGGQDAELREMTRAGQVRSIWNCTDTFGANFECYSNTINWNPSADTVVMSFPYQNTVVEIDRRSGALVGQYGDAAGSYTFSPSSWQFEFQHFANISRDGTLIVSSHMPGFAVTENPVQGQHAFMEFEIDRQNRRLIEKWIYNEGPEWAMYKGMALRLEGGNTLANYGTGGVIREITPDKRTAFLVKFDSERGNDFFNKMVGNNVLINDLYALNGGGPRPEQ